MSVWFGVAPGGGEQRQPTGRFASFPLSAVSLSTVHSCVLGRMARGQSVRLRIAGSERGAAPIEPKIRIRGFEQPVYHGICVFYGFLL